eukprot:423815-Prorocentrum_minimum.AAC.2
MGGPEEGPEGGAERRAGRPPRVESVAALLRRRTASSRRRSAASSRSSSASWRSVAARSAASWRSARSAGGRGRDPDGCGLSAAASRRPARLAASCRLGDGDWSAPRRTASTPRARPSSASWRSSIRRRRAPAACSASCRLAWGRT